MKFAYAVPRYGTEVIGGAEWATRMFAEHLVADLGCDVDVFTTCALDANTWADSYEPGTSVVNGVRVHRFRSEAGRHPTFGSYAAPRLARPEQMSPAEQARWIELQGPVCPAVVDAAAESSADACVFYPYLYWPTVHGVPRMASRAIVHPAAHDEPALRIPIFRDVFTTARGLVLQTDAERRLVERLFPVAHHPQVVLGLGVAAGAGEPAAAREAVGLGERPYLCCLGRVERGKGTDMLARFFAIYKQRRPGPLALVMPGPVVDRPPPHPDVVVTGPVDEDTKWGLLRGGLALVSPSGYEAFSLSVVEGWAAGIAVVVNARCDATREHCERSGGGLWFDGYGSFEAVIDVLTGDSATRERVATKGRAYVETHFRWPVIVERYARFVERAVGSRD